MSSPPPPPPPPPAGNPLPEATGNPAAAAAPHQGSNAQPTNAATTQPTNAATTQPTTTTTITTTTAIPAKPPQSTAEITDQAILEYLQKKGLGSAVLELSQILQREKTSSVLQNVSNNDNKSWDAAANNTTSSSDPLSVNDDSSSNNNNDLLTRATGGGFGYDRDAAWPLLSWGVGASIRDGISNNNKLHPIVNTNITTNTTQNQVGAAEAQNYIQSFCLLQVWVLSLPDNPTAVSSNYNATASEINDPIAKAKQILKNYNDYEKSNNNNEQDYDSKVELVLRQLLQQQQSSKSSFESNNSNNNTALNLESPPSAKPELLTLTFALLVHTFCELLEIGAESAALSLRDAFKSLYKPLYPTEFADLEHCTTTEDVMRLNAHNSQHMEALANLRQILVQVATYQLRREELKASTAMNNSNSNNNSSSNPEVAAKIQDYDKHISLLKSKYTDLSTRASNAFAKLHVLPFLRRARAVRWQITISTTSFALITQCLRDENMLPMSTLLQTKCELHIEQRPPMSVVPPCILELDSPTSTDKKKDPHELNKQSIIWATPSLANSVHARNSSSNNNIPFVKYHLDEKYSDPVQAAKDEQHIAFNRNLLVNGFRRLEALERQREYRSLTWRHDDSSRSNKRRREIETGGGDTTTIAMVPFSSSAISSALDPSILLSTLCAHQSGPTIHSSSFKANDVTSIWDETGIGLCCARICPPDGQFVAAGCNDSAVRIWNLQDSHRVSTDDDNQQNGGSGGGYNNLNHAPSLVLLGHKNGFPVFDVSWNRDGRALLSCGGDGSVRLWDTQAVGPFADVAAPPDKPTSSSSKTGEKSKKQDVKKELRRAMERASQDASMNVEGIKADRSPIHSGTALAVYRGHAPMSPVWSVEFSPSGYYFCSAGADATARLWTTDRIAPVRLFSGHTSNNVNDVSWHPNCNYVITGSDDKTARLWDVQSGQTVRLLMGAGAGINIVRISPCGRYAAGGDYSGIVHLWDMGTGKQICEFRSKPESKDSDSNVIHGLTFSACGSSLAAGGDDGCLRLWDVRRDSLMNKSIISTPYKRFATRRTVLMDLQYTKRNLLLSVGKYITPIPLAIPDID